MPPRLVNRILNRRPYPSRPGGWIRPLILLAGLAAIVPLAWFELHTVEHWGLEDQGVPIPEKVRKTELMRAGWEVVLAPGRAGVYRALVRTRYRGGMLVGRIEAERRLVRKPRPRERLLGTSERDNAINAPRLTIVDREYRMLATAYDAGPVDNTWEYAGKTKLGWRTRRGIVAVDPAVIQLRSLLYIEGYGLAWAGDVGGAIKGKRIDVCFNRTADALKWGRKNVYVYVLSGVRMKSRP